MGAQADGGNPGGGDRAGAFTVGALGHPFEGGARIGTGAFDLILERFETSKLNDIQ